MAAFDALNQATGVARQVQINPTTDECPNKNCAYWDLDKCAFAECRFTVPEVVHVKIRRKCIIDGTIFVTDAVSMNTICPKCISDLRDAIRLKHSPGSDD